MKKLELLKCSRVKNERRYDNLFLRIDGGQPIEIQLARWNPKIKNFLLANATNADIRTQTIVSLVDAKIED